MDPHIRGAFRWNTRVLFHKFLENILRANNRPYAHFVLNQMCIIQRHLMCPPVNTSVRKHTKTDDHQEAYLIPEQIWVNNTLHTVLHRWSSTKAQFWAKKSCTAKPKCQKSFEIWTIWTSETLFHISAIYQRKLVTQKNKTLSAFSG